MDFTFPTEADDAAELAAQILKKHATPERLAAVEATGSRFDPVLWDALRDAGLVSLPTAEEHGGAGLGLLEVARVLVEVGRTVAPVPLAPDAVARLFLAEHGSDAQQREGADAVVLTCAVTEEHEHAPATPATVAAQDGAEVVLTGTKHLVPAATVADAFLVTATGQDGPAVFLVPAGTDGLRVQEQRLSDGDVVGLLELDGVRIPADRRVGLVGGAGRLTDLLTIAVCALQLGVTEGAVALTAQYAKTREQFERPIGTFQAVAQRLADGYIDTRFQGLTLWQAAWRLAEGLPAQEAVATAKLWAADAGHRVAHTAIHVHGGVGIDLDGEAHRYFTTAKRYEFQQGSATEHALRLGRLLAAEPA